MAFGSIAPGMDDEDALLQLQMASGGPQAAAGASGPFPAVSQPPPPQNAPAPTPPTPAPPPPPHQRPRTFSDVFGDLLGFPQPGAAPPPPEPPGETLYKSPDGRIQLTQGDINKTIGLAMGFSGGGLGTKAYTPSGIGWHEALEGVPRAIQEPHPAISGTATAPAPIGGPAAGGDVTGGIGGGDDRLEQAQAQAERAAGRYAPLPGLPQKGIPVGDNLYVPGPIAKIKDTAEQYMRGRLTSGYHTPPEQYYPLDPEHSKNIAQAFEDMQHAPNDPAVKNSYDAMIKETRDQYDAIRKYHPDLQLVPNKPGEDPYAATPRLAARDVFENNRLHFFPTEQGYGADVNKGPSQINWDRSTVGGRGSIPVGPDRKVIDVPTIALDQAHIATDPEMHVDVPKQQVRDHIAAGNPISLPEVGAVDGRIGFSNGRNRVAVAREMGEPTVPIVVDKDNEQAVRDVINKYTPPELDPNHPMLQPSGRTLEGKPLLNNDLFRIVHDYYGHLQEGYGFRAAGEDNAWRKHASMYSDLARPAMTTETRGQNSWVNFGPHAEQNKGASAADTVYAPQKVGLMPEWTMRDRGSPEPMITYRGSPSAHSMVDMSKIGTGEGSGVRGEGMYSAEAQPVGTFYRHFTATTQDPLLKKYKINSFDANNMGRDLGTTGGDHGPVVEDLNDHIENLKAKQAEGDTTAMTKNQIKSSQAMIRYLNDPNRATGHMYELALDKPDEQYLHWDKPLSEQSQFVKDKLQPIIDARTPEIQKARATLLAKAQQRLAANPPGIMQQKLQADIQRYSQPVNWEDTPGSKLYVAAAHHALGRPPVNADEAYPVASQYLRTKGIAGIKYLAGQNFNLPPGVPAGSHNYVSFNPERILKRYVVPGAIGTGLGASMMSRGQENGT